MNRMEEYRQLMLELNEPVLEVEQTLERAKRKKRRFDRVCQSMLGAAATFVLFVLLVNFSASVAYACSQVPVLRELAEAVTFSSSLTDAVDNEYVQMMNLVQQDGEVSAKVEYLIVDQKQVNVFFRLYSDVYNQMYTDLSVLEADGSSPAPCFYGVNGGDVPNGELRGITIDFVDNNVPDSLRLKLDIRGFSIQPGEAEAAVSVEEDMFRPIEPEEKEYVAHFDFLLEFDPQFTAVGKEFIVNETVILEGQKITITDVAIYPSHMRVNIADDSENTAWLKHLNFYIETDNGMKFEPVSGGVTATGSDNSPTMESFRADSSYFYDAKELKIVITGAQWLKKDMEKLYINLETGETDILPEGVKFYSAEEKTEGWILELQAEHKEGSPIHQILSSKFYDAEGNEYEIRSWSTTSEFSDETEKVTHFIEEVPLADYHEKEVWVSPLYSHEWTAEEPVVVQVR